MMKAWLRATCFGMLLGGFAGSIGCAPVTPLPPPPSTPVSISTFKDVAGKWAGILKRAPRAKEDDWITLTIDEDGRYHFEAMRVIGIFHGEGTFMLIDGKLKAETQRGSGVATLYESAERRMLKVEGMTKDGIHYSGDLDPAK